MMHAHDKTALLKHAKPESGPLASTKAKTLVGRPIKDSVRALSLSLCFFACCAALSAGQAIAASEEAAQIFEGLLKECKDGQQDSCFVQNEILLNEDDVCGLRPKIMARDKEAAKDLIHKCIPERIFKGRETEVVSYTIKRDILEKGSYTMEPDRETIVFRYSVKICASFKADFSGLVTFVPEGSAIFLMGDIPSQCALR